MSDRRIAEAFEQMSPTPEAEDRMLAGILAAAEEPEAQPKAFGTQPETASTQQDVSTLPHTSARISSPWKIALPIAASLVLLVGVGIFAMSSLEKSNETMASMSAESTSAGSASDSAAPSVEEENSEAAPKSSEVEPLSDNAPEADEGTDAADAAALPNEYPYIEFTESDGTEIWFMVCFDDQDNANIPDSRWIGKSLGSATAWNPDLTESVPCTFYECPTTAIPYYIIQYEGDSTYYLVLGTQKP